MRMFASLFVLACLVSAPAVAIEDGAYATPPAMEVLSLMAPTPVVGSLEEKADIEAVLAAQRTRTRAQIKFATDDAEPSVFRYADVLGVKFNAQNLPLAAKLFLNLRKTQSLVTGPAKDCFLGPRPFLLDARVHPIDALKADSANDPNRPPAALPRGPGTPCKALPDTPPAYSYSYPSGHATFGALTAIVLARMVPEHRDAIYARGWTFGWNRVVAGIHAPSALESGRIVATLIGHHLDTDPRFAADFAAAKAQVRAGLDLAP